MILRRLEVGPLLVNCYIIGCENSGLGAVIDPGDDAERILQEVEAMKIKVVQIINTHGHADHIHGNRQVKEATGADIYIHREDADMLTIPRENLSVYFGPAVDSPPADCFLEEGKIHQLGELKFKVLHIPGHSRGSVCLLRNNKAFVGDTLFAGSIGRTDFPYGSYETLTNGIKEKLFKLNDSTEVFPGHGPPTTIGRERKHNPFLT